jgi:hypothetical protein
MTMVSEPAIGDAPDVDQSTSPRAWSTMTTSFADPRPDRRGPSPAATVTVGIIATVAVAAFILAGLTFLALAIAFPIVLPVAEAYHLPVSAADAAIAESLAPMWWAFAALSLATFVAAAVVAVKVTSFFAPRD